MSRLEVLAALLAAGFTGGILSYLYYALSKIPRTFSNPEVAARARRDAPYHLLDRVMSKGGEGAD